MKQIGDLNKLYRQLKKIKSHIFKIKTKSDFELAQMTQIFKNRIAAGEQLDAILPEAFAVVCEADYRILGKFPYDTQILGGIALHQGYLAEMNTGEGKTLSATLPLYLNALTGKGVMLVTTNSYLALRDAEEMGAVYRFLGLTVAAGVHEDPAKRFTNAEKKAIYNCDIVYTTHSTLGFDYLLNNLVTSAQERFMRGLSYVIIDEADAVLLDAAQMPLLISGAPRVQSKLYQLADFFVTTLIPGVDYESEEKHVWLTESGVRRAEYFFEVKNFYSEECFEINRHVILALRAHVLFENGKEYMVSEQGEIVLLDVESGRKKPGSKLRGGQHQALEVKERIPITQENRSMASITYQSFFTLFDKMAGMSGTISDSAVELLQVYKKKVIVIPPHKAVERQDLPDLYFVHAEDQLMEAMKMVILAHKKSQPVLIVVSAIRETEIVSKLLLEEDIPHNVLNANNEFWEAEIIRDAGKKNAVTVATSMAGRGTDIKLGEGVRELGGLAVVGIGRMSNVRQERQTRGRAGRQGDPGVSRFFVSVDDEIVRIHSAQAREKFLKRGERSQNMWKKTLIDQAQALGEESAILSRKLALDYDQVIQRQRGLMYELRNRLLDGETIDRERLKEMAERVIDAFLDENELLSKPKLTRYILENISYRLGSEVSYLYLEPKEVVRKYLVNLVSQQLDIQEKRLGGKAQMGSHIRACALKAIDDAWVEQVDYLQQLQTIVKGRALAQRTPVNEYQQEALLSFEKMNTEIMRNTIRNVLLGTFFS